MDPNRSLSYPRSSNNFAFASPAQARAVQVNVTDEVPKIMRVNFAFPV